MKDFLNGITNPEMIWAPILLWIVVAILLIRLYWRKNWSFLTLWLPLTLLAVSIPSLMIMFVCPGAGGDMAPLCVPFLGYIIVAEVVVVSTIVAAVAFLRKRKNFKNTPSY